MNEQGYRLTPFEQSMYLAQISDPESTEYSVNCYFDITGAEKKDVERAVYELIKNHESLHSCYEERNGEPVRLLSDKLPNFEWVKASSEEEAKKLVAETSKPFSLKTIPLRLTGYTLPENRILLHIAIHHIAMDGKSVKIMTEEIFNRLHGKDIASAKDLSSRVDYYDNFEEGKKYYHELFPDGIVNNDMPTKNIRPYTHPCVDAKKSITFNKEELTSFSNTAKKYGVTTFNFLLSAISITLGKYCDSEDMVFGFPVDMRNNETADMVGMFINTAIVRLKPERNKSIQDYLSEVSQIVKTSARGKWLPMSEFIREFKVPTDNSRNPVFDVGINSHL